MNQLRVRSAEAAGTARERAWSQVHVAQTSQGTLLILVSLSYTGEGDLVELAQIGTSLLESLSVKGALRAAEIEGLGSEIEASIVVVEQNGESLKVGGVGAADVYIWREGKLGRVFTGTKEIKQTAGPVEVGDRLMIVTRALGEALSAAGINKFLRSGLEAREDLAVLIHGEEDSSRMAAIIGEVEREEKTREKVKQEYRKLLTIGGWKERIASIGSKLIPKKPLYIQEEKRKWNLMVGLALIVLLVLGVGSGMWRRTKMVAERAYVQMEASVSQKMQEARSIADLNPERAKLLLSQGRGEIEQYLKEVTDENYRKKASATSEEIKKVEEEIFKKQEITLNTLMELQVIKNGLTAEKMFMDEEGSLLLPDLNNPQVQVVNLADKSSMQIELAELGKAKELAVYDDKTYGIVATGIFLLEGKEKRIVITPDELWGEITLIDVFGGNVYLLDRGQSEIWKYPVLTEGFGTRRRWLGAGISLDLSNVIDMKVDGDIWLLTLTGKLERYSRGVPVTFSMEGFPAITGERLEGPVAIFVAETKVYVLEAGAKRVVVFEKESGKYERQYAAEELAGAKDLVVWEDKAYVLLADRIGWFQL